MKDRASFFTIGVFCGALIAAVTFATLPKKSGGDSFVRTLKLAHNLETTHPVHAGLEFFKKRVEELSGGKLTMDIYSGSSLGSEPKCIEQLKNGSLDMTKASSAQLGMFEPRLNALTLPYVFRDRAHYWSVLDSDLGEKFLRFLHEQGMIGLCFFDAGSRSFYTTKKKIFSPDDLAGLKIRVMNSRVDLEMIKAFGASPTPISSGETYTALSQGVVDGAENNPPTYLLGGQFEVAKFFTLDEHTSIPDILVIGEQAWKSLSKEEQDVMRRAAKEASVFQRKLWSKREAEALQQLKDKGVEIINVDKKKFAERVQPLIDTFKNTQIGTLAEEIKAKK